MRRPIRLLVVVLAGVAFGTLTPMTGPAIGATPEPPTTIGGYDLERPPSECIGLLQRPDCGKEPEDAGERGGALQYVVFGIMLGGLALIFTVVFRNVIRADRAKAAEAAKATEAQAEPTTKPESGEQVPTER